MHLSSLKWDLGVLAKAPTQVVPGLGQGFLSEAVGTTGAGISRDVPGRVMHPPWLRRGELAQAGLESVPEMCVCWWEATDLLRWCACGLPWRRAEHTSQAPSPPCPVPPATAAVFKELYIKAP